MNKESTTGTGIRPVPVLLLFAALFFLLIVPATAANFSQAFIYSDIVHYNQTYVTDTSGTTPILIWISAIVLGVILIVLSFIRFPDGEEGLISIMAWFPIAYAMYTSFSVDLVTGYGVTGLLTNGTINTYVLLENHTVYAFHIIAAGLFMLLFFAIGNTLRIWLNSRRVRQEQEPVGEDLNE